MVPLLRSFGGRSKRSLHPVTYDAILFKRFTITSSPKRPDSALVNYVWQNVFAKENMIVDSAAKRVGNRDGLGWMQRMELELRTQKSMIDQLADKSRGQEIAIDKLVEESKAQKIINDKEKRRWFIVRATEIEKSGHAQSEEAILARRERNQAIHGGNIAEDLAVVEFMKAETTQQRHDSLRAAFEAWYEVSLRHQHRIIRAPNLIIRTFNILADTKSRWGWSNDPRTQDEARRICRDIIGRWLEHVDTAKGEYPEDHIRREFGKLDSLKSA